VRERFVAEPLIWGELLGASGLNGERSILGSSHVQRPWSTADVAVLKDLPFFVGVDVDFNDLEAIGANDFGRIFHDANPISLE
jgi:hypothetical protein